MVRDLRLSRAGAAVVTLALSCVALAQSADGGGARLAPVVVTATRTEEFTEVE